MSSADDIGDDGEHRVQCDDADDADDHRPRRRHADIGGAASGPQADAAARHPDQDGESDAFDEAEHELVERHRVERLMQIAERR